MLRARTGESYRAVRCNSHRQALPGDAEGVIVVEQVGGNLVVAVHVVNTALSGVLWAVVCKYTRCRWIYSRADEVEKGCTKHSGEVARVPAIGAAVVNVLSNKDKGYHSCSFDHISLDLAGPT